MSALKMKECPRCGESHSLEFATFTRSAGPYSRWSLCPTTGEPVLALGEPMSLWNFIRQHVSAWPTLKRATP